MHQMVKSFSFATRLRKLWKNQSGKSLDAIPFCKIDFKDIRKNTPLTFLSRDPQICSSCFAKMAPHYRYFKAGGLKCLTLFDYEGDIRSLVFQLKGAGDVELGPVFLSRISWLLKLRFRGFVIVPAPSSQASDESRGFNHVEAIFSYLGLPLIKAISKTDDYKQSNMSGDERKEIGRHILLSNKESVLGRKILLVDDVFTTGNTALACSKLLLKAGAKKVFFISVAKTPKRREHG